MAGKPSLTPAVADPQALIASEVRRRYAALRAHEATSCAITVLHIGAELSALAVGSGVAPDRILVLELGSARTAREHFKRATPTALELETAIASVEDELARAQFLVGLNSTLHSTDSLLREIALAAGVSGDKRLVLGLAAVDQTFDRLAAVALGRPAASAGLPQSAEFGVTLLILREFMHHLRFAACLVDGR
jgi:hypothetical protein